MMGMQSRTKIYNKQSCRECGSMLMPHSFCTIRKEHVSWVCGQCCRTEDYTDVHDYCRQPAPVIVVENLGS